MIKIALSWLDRYWSGEQVFRYEGPHAPMMGQRFTLIYHDQLLYACLDTDRMLPTDVLSGQPFLLVQGALRLLIEDYHVVPISPFLPQKKAGFGRTVFQVMRLSTATVHDQAPCIYRALLPMHLSGLDVSQMIKQVEAVDLRDPAIKNLIPLDLEGEQWRLYQYQHRHQYYLVIESPPVSFAYFSDRMSTILLTVGFYFGLWQRDRLHVFGYAPSDTTTFCAYHYHQWPPSIQHAFWPVHLPKALTTTSLAPPKSRRPHTRITPADLSSFVLLLNHHPALQTAVITLLQALADFTIGAQLLDVVLQALGDHVRHYHQSVIQLAGQPKKKKMREALGHPSLGTSHSLHHQQGMHYILRWTTSSSLPSQTLLLRLLCQLWPVEPGNVLTPPTGVATDKAMLQWYLQQLSVIYCLLLTMSGFKGNAVNQWAAYCFATGEALPTSYYFELYN